MYTSYSSRQVRGTCTFSPCINAITLRSRCPRYRRPSPLVVARTLAHSRFFDSFVISRTSRYALPSPLLLLRYRSSSVASRPLFLSAGGGDLLHSPALCYSCATVCQVLHPRPYFWRPMAAILSFTVRPAYMYVSCDCKPAVVLPPLRHV